MRFRRIRSVRPARPKRRLLEGSGTSGDPYTLPGGEGAASCKAYLNHSYYDSEGDGVYHLDPGSVTAFDAKQGPVGTLTGGV